MRDLIGVNRGECSHAECLANGDPCPDYYAPNANGAQFCIYCNHSPIFHARIVENADGSNTSTSTVPVIDVDPNLNILTEASGANSEVQAVTEQVPVDTPNINNTPVYKYLPDKMSEYVSPLLDIEGKFPNLSAAKKMENSLMHQIIAHLNENNLIMNVNPANAKLEYSLLRQELHKKYPNLRTHVWHGDETKAKSTQPHVFFVSRVAKNRKVQRCINNKKAKTVRENGGVEAMNQYLKELKTLTLAQLDKIDGPLYLRATFSLRLMEFPETLPLYLRSKENLFEEIELRADCTISHMKRKLTQLLNMYSQDQAGRVVSARELEQYLHVKTYEYNEDREVTSTEDRSFFLEFDDDFVYSEEDLHPRCGYCIMMTNGHLYLNDMKKFHVIRGNFSLNEAVIAGFGAYYIFNRQYPERFAQFLGLLEIVFKPGSVNSHFPRSERKSKLTALLKRMNIK